MCMAVGRAPLEVATCMAVAMLGNAMCMVAQREERAFAPDKCATQRCRHELAARDVPKQRRRVMSTAATEPEPVAPYMAVTLPAAVATYMAVTVAAAAATYTAAATAALATSTAVLS